MSRECDEEYRRVLINVTAVYEAMLPRQPLRFLLAMTPGAGKAIVAALLIKESSPGAT